MCCIICPSPEVDLKNHPRLVENLPEAKQHLRILSLLIGRRNHVTRPYPITRLPPPSSAFLRLPPPSSAFPRLHPPHGSTHRRSGRSLNTRFPMSCRCRLREPPTTHRYPCPIVCSLCQLSQPPTHPPTHSASWGHVVLIGRSDG